MILSLGDGSQYSQIPSVLDEAYISECFPQLLSDYIDKPLASPVSNLMARIHDDSFMKDGNPIPSAKLYGERMWLVRVGIAWLHCRRLKSFRLASFRLTADLAVVLKHKVRSLLKVEVMIDSDTT